MMLAENWNCSLLGGLWSSGFWGEFRTLFFSCYRVAVSTGCQAAWYEAPDVAAIGLIVPWTSIGDNNWSSWPRYFVCPREMSMFLVFSGVWDFNCFNEMTHGRMVAFFGNCRWSLGLPAIFVCPRPWSGMIYLGDPITYYYI